MWCSGGGSAHGKSRSCALTAGQAGCVGTDTGELVGLVVRVVEIDLICLCVFSIK